MTPQEYVDQLVLACVHCAFKAPSELSDLEKVSLALAAGCAIKTSWEGLRLVVRTVNPVTIEKIDDKFVVYERRDIPRGP